MKYRRRKFGTQGAQMLCWCAIGLLQWVSAGATATELHVLEGRPLQLRVFDLAGRQVRALEEEGTAGSWRLVWDGRDESGAPVPPGHYLLRLDVEGDARSQRITGLVQVVY